MGIVVAGLFARVRVREKILVCWGQDVSTYILLGGEEGGGGHEQDSCELVSEEEEEAHLYAEYHQRSCYGGDEGYQANAPRFQGGSSAIAILWLRTHRW